MKNFIIAGIIVAGVLLITTIYMSTVEARTSINASGVTFSYTVPLNTAYRLGNASCYYNAERYGYTVGECLQNTLIMRNVTDLTISGYAKDLIGAYESEMAQRALQTPAAAVIE